MHTPKVTFTCPENCGYSTHSETQFCKHLIDAHAVRPNQVPRILARVEKQNVPQGRTRKAVQSRNEIVLGQPIRCYDNGGSDKPKGSLDRYTVVFMHRDYLASHGDIYPCLGMSGTPFHPQGIAQHSDCKLGKHLGRRIKFSELPEDCQKAVLQDLSSEQ